MGIHPYQSYATKLKQDDVIKMVTNMDDKSLKYIINGIDYGKALYFAL